MIWEPGDKALATSPMDPGLPTLGTLWDVLGVRVVEWLGEPQCFLQLAGQPPELWFMACLFTKLGGHEMDADDFEVIRAMQGKRLAPV